MISPSENDYYAAALNDPYATAGGPDVELHYTIILDANGYRDEAEAETESAALLAAATLVEDREAAGDNRRSLRAKLLIARDGRYDARLTNAARNGRRQP